ncbi:hypothetical protein XENOCAPTIV_030832 [Xenoophorus captivus]|uniref:F-box domain-containing protein n=1 Tax=Xenoophorus captivus TaxID=1517983 RepID=A0ABV0RPF7_9TELE
MAAVVERVDGCVGSLDTDAVSLRHSTSPQEQPHQNNPLLGLPIVAIETILNFLSYDEISMLRSVSRTQQLDGRRANASLGTSGCHAGRSYRWGMNPALRGSAWFWTA